jgi:hypothetical protein
MLSMDVPLSLIDLPVMFAYWSLPISLIDYLIAGA